MKNWCSKYWLYAIYTLGVIMAIVSVMHWADWSIPERIAALNSIILPLHVIEEWRKPAGFHYQYNLLMGSDIPDRYPMNMQTDMITNLGGELFFILMLILKMPAPCVLALLVFDLLEAIVHTVCGVMMYSRFKSKGKRTIYGPGSFTAYAGHLPCAVTLLVWCSGVTFRPMDYAGMVIVLAIMLIGLIVIPESLLKKRENPYAFPSAGYFEKFL